MSIYGDSIFTENSANWLNSEIVNEATYDGVYSIQEAKFSFLPKFKSEGLEKYERVAKEAEDLLNSEGEPTKTTCEKAFKIIFKVFGILEDVGSLLAFPICFTIVGIIPYLFMRFWSWFYYNVSEIAAESEGKKIIAKFKELENKEKDPKKKALYKEKREKVAAKMAKMRGKGDDED